MIRRTGRDGGRIGAAGRSADMTSDVHAGDGAAGKRRTLPSLEEVMADRTLTREEKVVRLREMRRDAWALEVASNEGMGGPASGLQRIYQALRDLGAERERP